MAQTIAPTVFDDAKLQKLQAEEAAIESTEKLLELIRLTKLSQLYEKRREITSCIEQFWYVVLSQNEDFGEFIKPTESFIFEYLTDLYITWENYEPADLAKFGPVDELLLKLAKKDPQRFNLTFVFECDNGDVPTQTIVKRFRTVSTKHEDEADDVQLFGEPVKVHWPDSLSQILGLLRKKSFFTLFEWTGLGPRDEDGLDVNGIVDLLMQDIYPSCTLYYALVQEDQLQEELAKGEESEEELKIKTRQKINEQLDAHMDKKLVEVHELLKRMAQEQVEKEKKENDRKLKKQKN